MDNRTIRNAVTNRVPEVYYVSPPTKIGSKIKFLMIAKIRLPNMSERPFYLCADMPDTALVSHRELLSTMVSEVYDEVGKIKRGEKHPEIVPDERSLPPLSKRDLKAFDFNEIEDMLSDSPQLLIP